MRKIKRHRRHKKSYILVFPVLCIFFLFASAYAAFTTNVNITAKGNISNITGYEMLRNKCQSANSDSIYKDPYENERCIYKGNAPNNYLTFNNEPWRIIALEQDGTIKIIKNTSATTTVNFDDQKTNRYNASGWCTDKNGCNIYGSSNNTKDSSGNKIDHFVVGGENIALPNVDSLAKDYLNSTGIYSTSGWYNSVDTNDKALIVEHDFKVGPINTSVGNAVAISDLSLDDIIAMEKTYLWSGKVGLINPSDYQKSLINGTTYLNIETEGNENHYWYWGINPITNYRGATVSVYLGIRHGYVYYGTGSTVGLVPVVFLNGNIYLTGKGSKDSPYIIRK